jgi:hypothetical protein
MNCVVSCAIILKIEGVVFFAMTKKTNDDDTLKHIIIVVLFVL